MTDGELQQAVLQLRANSDGLSRQNALEDLCAFKDPRATTALLELLPALDIMRAGDGYAIAHVISELAGRGERRVIPFVLAQFDQLVEDSPDDHQMQAVACEALTALRATEALPFLESAMTSTQFTDCEEDVTAALAAIGGTAVEDVLLDAVSTGRPALRVAALEALRTAGTAKSLAAVEKASKSKHDETRTAALGTLFVLDPAKARPTIERAIKGAKTRLLQVKVVWLLRAVRGSDISDVMASLLANPEWSSFRFELLEALVLQQSALAAPQLQLARADASLSSWGRARASAMLLDLDYNESIIEELLALLQLPSLPEDEDFHQLNLAITVIVKGLARHAPRTPARFLSFVLLMDDFRRGRRAPVASMRGNAAAAVEEIVGSAYYDDYDAWVAKYRAAHAL